MKIYDTITPELKSWVLDQSVFFTASAPLHGAHINVSPKGLPNSTFTIFGPNSAGYIDATGSGNETISHIRENGRITIMFCSFAAAPRILRFYCWGRVVEWDEKGEFDRLVGEMVGAGNKLVPGARAVVLLDVFKAVTSCGFGVPLLAMKPDPADPAKHVPYMADRDTLGHWAGKQVEQNKLEAYQEANNVDSWDGLPGLRAAMRSKDGRVRLLLKDAKAWSARHRDAMMMSMSMLTGMILTVVILQALGLTTVASTEWKAHSL